MKPLLALVVKPIVLPLMSSDEDFARDKMGCSTFLNRIVDAVVAVQVECLPDSLPQFYFSGVLEPLLLELLISAKSWSQGLLIVHDAVSRLNAKLLMLAEDQGTKLSQKLSRFLMYVLSQCLTVHMSWDKRGLDLIAVKRNYSTVIDLLKRFGDPKLSAAAREIVL